MSILEKPSSSTLAQDIAKLKDLNEKGQSLRGKVVSLVSELKEARCRLVSKDEEIAKLKDEIKIMSAQGKLKTKVLRSQVKASFF